MKAFLVSTGIVALAEVGDRTQIATVMLAARRCGRTQKMERCYTFPNAPICSSLRALNKFS